MPPTKSLPKDSIFATGEIKTMSRQELINYTFELISTIPQRGKRKAYRRQFVKRLKLYRHLQKTLCALTIYTLERYS